MSGSQRHSAPLRVIVADDEPPARALLSEYLAAHPGAELVAECGHGFEVVQKVEELHPDVLLLDIRMPKLDGFEVLELLSWHPQVVFTTAYDEYAIKAFEVEAVDYLLKPFEAERLYRALDRARDRLVRGDGQPLESLARTHRSRQAPLARLLVREGPRIHVVPAEDVDFIESQDDYVLIRAGGLELRKKQTLAELQDLLDPGRFVRIHRCYLLNLDRLARLEAYAKGSHVAFLRDGARLPVSRTGYGRLKRLL